MPIKQRDKGGKATSRFDERSLYDVVKAVAEHAQPEDPAGVTQRKWDAARAGAGYPDAPTARCICMRLRIERTQESFPWPKLIEAIFDPEVDIDRIEITRRQEPDTRDFGRRHVWFAMHVIAKRLGAHTVRPLDYAAEREKALAEERRRGGHALFELLPTQSQLEAIARRVLGLDSRPSRNDWARVLEIAELKPNTRVAGRPTRGLPMPEAFDEYFLANGTEVWPSRQRLVQFAKLGEFRLAAMSMSWPEHIAKSRRRREQRGLPCPTVMPANAPKPGPPVKGPVRPVPNAPPRSGWSKSIHTPEKIMAALEAYDRDAGPGPRTQDGYRTYAKEHGLPAPSYLERVDGFVTAMKRIRAKRTAAQR